eukprot:CAMPEP_0116558728 /NCGR_PEP_ID=MMETSP0397-20121206/9981_1 /TAXON_ID=216820 /ORGANISM="Cyclophora tenuis, Strain ECT3854" /LENGTH=595 /DNA_ID=CAMNT_0004084377 /DNA_START=184 /DNA_END=1971 /DNA_ORIENTATION=-
MAKLKEAEEYRDKATKAMENGLFSRPDPIAAGNYYKRAADAYGLCGENRLERLHRIAAADCQKGFGSYPTAAAEYMKAAVLAKNSDETLERKRKEGWKLYSDAASAWRNAGEMGKAANCQILSAMAWTWEDDTTMLDKQALNGIEEAIEAHVPDVLNIYARYRQTGQSKFMEPGAPRDQKPSQETMVLAEEHLVKVPYAHEPIQEVASVLVHYGEYQSALYAVGAASYILENDGIATLTLSRSYVAETILSLAMGDPVMAEEQFLNRHVQKTHYLSSRECRLGEELFRAILQRDAEALEEARSPSGPNRAALANLNEKFRNLVLQLRISGAARRTLPAVAKPAAQLDDDDDDEEIVATPKMDEPERTPRAVKRQDSDDDDDDDLDPDALAGELDDVMKGLDDLGDFGDDDDDLDDDDIDYARNLDSLELYNIRPLMISLSKRQPPKCVVSFDQVCMCVFRKTSSYTGLRTHVARLEDTLRFLTHVVAQLVSSMSSGSSRVGLFPTYLGSFVGGALSQIQVGDDGTDDIEHSKQAHAVGDGGIQKRDEGQSSPGHHETDGYRRFQEFGVLVVPEEDKAQGCDGLGAQSGHGYDGWL